MSKIIIIGGIESTYRNAQTLFEQGEDILMFFTRGENSAGWEGVDLVDESQFSFLDKVDKTIVEGNINAHSELIASLRPDYIWSLGWQQIFRKELLSIAPILGIHESLLPEGAGPVPIANAILHDQVHTGITLFQVDKGMDTGPIIWQLQGSLDPRKATSTELYDQAMLLAHSLIKVTLPFLNNGQAPRISQDLSKRTAYKKINWNEWPEDKVTRAKTYPYI
jgi:methionyl-tRNA formyltransferase